MTQARLPFLLVLTSFALAGCSDDGTASEDTSNETGNTATTGEPGPTSITTPSTSITTTGDEPTTGVATSDTAEPTTQTGPTSDTQTPTGGATEADTSGTGAPGENTIYQIQMGDLPEGSMVHVEGVVVTGVAPSGNAFFAQEPDGGEYSGVSVYVDALDISGLEIGDEVTIDGTVDEYNGLTEIDASAGAVDETGTPGPLAPGVVALADLASEATAEPWEGVLVQVDEGSPVMVDTLPGDNEFSISAGGNSVLVDNYLYSALEDAASFPDLGLEATFGTVAGVLNYNGDAFKVAPRSADDLTDYVPGNPAASVDDMGPGDLVVTEIMYDPATCANDTCEWIEIYNDSGVDVNLLGLVVRDSAANEGEVMDSVVLPAGEYAVIADGDEGTWPYAVDISTLVFISMPALNNTTDSVAIGNTTMMIDTTAVYSSDPSDDGHSWKLDGNPGTTDNAVVDNWCWSDTAIEGTDFGTPGMQNDPGCAVF